MSLEQTFVHTEHSISRYISGLRDGDETAAQKIWERFIHRLVRLASAKLKRTSRSSADEEDVVQQAFSDFFAQVQDGRFPKLNDRSDLWQVLAMLVDRRATDQIRRQTSQRAGGGNVVNASSLHAKNDDRPCGLLAYVPSREPTAAEAMSFVEALRDRLSLLHDAEQRKVALLKLQGYSNAEIADQICSSLRTVERTLNRIRSVWESQRDEA